MNNSLPKGYKNAELLHKRLQQKPEKEWLRNGKRRVQRQYKAMVAEVSAYSDFLKANGVHDPKSLDIAKLGTIPTMDKANYLRQYNRDQLCWGGSFSNDSWVISTTSGSTGVPYYFPRTDVQDQYLTITTELYLRYHFQIQDKSTLYIDAFPMGAWIGGVFTYESIRQLAEKDYKISIITPGIHKQEVINAFKELAADFDQVVIGAYAPFLKDILDDGVRQGIDWKQHEVGFVFSAEAFSEKFRDYVIDTVGAKDELRMSLNHYGSVDLGTMAHETPLSVMIRRLLVQDDKLNVLFPEVARQPTFVQYNPELFYFEEEDNNLICTSFSGLPLCRYDLKDYGGVMPYREVKRRLKKAGYDLDALIEQHGIGDTVWNLPFLYVYERNDFSVSYYAFLLYPDTVRRSLQLGSLQDLITGKFTMLVEYDTKGRQKLHIHVEKKHGVPDASLAKSLVERVHKGLLEESSEYRETFSVTGDSVKPVIHLWEYEDVKYFKPGVKQKWVQK